MAMITIVLVDDHQILREGVRNLLEDEPDIEVVGEAADGLQGIELTAKLAPHILITDLMMKGLNGIEVTREVRRRSPNTRIIVLSMYDDEGFVNQAMREGAMGYVLKGSGISELLTAIRMVTSGVSYLGSSLRS